MARGLIGEIIISLTHFVDLSVLVPLDSAVGNAIDIRKIRHEYGAQFVLQGRVRSLGARMRISVDLMDTGTGGNLWGRTF